MYKDNIIKQDINIWTNALDLTIINMEMNGLFYHYILNLLYRY